jgi:hypothetical protein
MRIGVVSSVVLTGVLLGGAAQAQSNPATGGGGGGGDSGGGDMDDKKIVVGGDLPILFPVSSDFGNATGPMLGILARGGYRITPPLELTARIGYLAGLGKSNGPVSTSISGFPIWLGARYYFQEPPAGFYGFAEIAINAFNVNASVGGASASQGFTREGFNLGGGYVISPDLPIDIRAQLSYINLLGTQGGESAAIALGLSVGYSFFF